MADHTNKLLRIVFTVREAEGTELLIFLFFSFFLPLREVGLSPEELFERSGCNGGLKSELGNSTGIYSVQSITSLGKHPNSLF